MTDKEKEVNYTPEMVERMRELAPLNLEKAEVLATEFGKKPRSVIAKAKREGIEYIAKARPEPKRTGPTKIQMVEALEETTGVTLAGLEKAPVATIKNLTYLLDTADVVEQGT